MKMNKDGLLLCELQADIFLDSFDKTTCSSEIFIRRFIYSKVVDEFDSKSILDNSITKEEVFSLIENEFGKTNYGQTKFPKESLYWIGYIYRYMAYTLNLTSKQVYKIIKPKELNGLFYIYHTFDITQAIERILEDKNLSFSDEDRNKQLFKLLRKQRNKELLYLVHLDESNNNNLNILFNNRLIGTVEYEKLLDNYYKIKISVDNKDEYISKELDEIVIEKVLDYAKENDSIMNLKVSIDRNNNREINLYKQNGFLYFDEDNDYIQLYKKIK